MNLRKVLFTYWALIASVVSFAQESSNKEFDFIYKSVEGHDIEATIYLPESNKRIPLVIYFHGGGFVFGNRTEGMDATLKENLLSNEIAVISADYRLAPETKLKETLKDVSDIITWVKDNGEKSYNIDTSKIAVVGGSAGGYLALSSGFNLLSVPNAIIAISAPTGFSTNDIKTGDLSNLYKIPKDSIISHGDYHNRIKLWRNLTKNGLILYEIFGFDPTMDTLKLKEYTLTNNITTDYPPTLIIHAKNDRLVKASDAKDFHDFLLSKKIDSELYWVEEGHSSDLINKNPDAIDTIITFLNKQFNK